jgi:hypothetical protein
MTDQPGTPAGPTPEPRPPTFEQRMEGFGRDAQAAGERIGRQAQAAGERLAHDPTVQTAADTAARVWGLLLIAVGAWFFAEVTLGYDLPSIPWRDVWPLGLIVVGLIVVFRGMRRRGA